MSEPAVAAASVWEAVIGVEVHVQLRTATKMFCACRVGFGDPPNSRVCPVCLGLPGALPVPNAEAVRLGLRAALALGCEIAERSAFDRKHYFYPDLPKGYQISQLARPLAERGEVSIRHRDTERPIRIRRLHLEEDAGKSVHDRFPDSSAIDLNRAGVPLAEIVTEPDLRSPAETRAFLLRLKQLLEHFADVSDCNMEEGSLRVDANISVRRRGDEAYGTKTEIKNLNSFAFAERALAYERDRQIAMLERGKPLRRETRSYDPRRGETRPLRGKEEDFDYRYTPDPDLVPIRVEPSELAAAGAGLGPLPHELERELTDGFGLDAETAVLIAATPDRAAYFLDVVVGREAAFARRAATFVMGGLAAARNRATPEPREADLLSATRLRRLVELREDGTLSSDTASRALELILADPDEEVDALVERHGLAQIGDATAIDEWVDQTLAEHPDEARRWRSGEDKLVGFLIGAVMRASGGRADPALVRSRLDDRR